MRYRIPSLVIFVLLIGAGVSAGQVTFKANNSFAENSGRREEVTIVVTAGQNGYNVSGQMKWQTENKTCSIRGTYYAATGLLRARCDDNVINATAIMADGKRALNLTEPFSAIARQVDSAEDANQASMPKVMEECEKYDGNICGTWKRNGNQFEATWSNGAKATLVIEKFDKDEVVITRRDRTDSVSSGFTATYTARINGNMIVDGVVTWTSGGRSWSGTWTANW